MLAAASLVLAGCQTFPSQSEDAQINSEIKGKLVESQVDLSRVGVDTQNGAVYLSGAVSSPIQRAHVEQIARNVLARSTVIHGQVINRLQIQPVILEDPAITASVKTRLMNDRMINASQIGVETQQGLVTLSGVVPSSDQKMRAEQLTHEVPGVTRVANHLQVLSSSAPPPAMPDDLTITAAVKERLASDRVTNLMRINVDTTRHIVYLNGVVPSSDQKMRAELLASQVNGVTQVVNNLQVQP